MSASELLDAAGWLALSFGSLALLASSFLVLLVRRRCPALIDLSHPSPEPWPQLSVIIPACNEGETIEAALSSLLTVDYPAVEFIVIDDRSTDQTGAIIDRIAALDPRVVPVHISELPPGWLGKVHAMQRGLEQSRGKWVLLTDADVHFEPDALRRAIACAEAEDLNHLALLPEIPMRGFLVGIAIAAAFRSLLVMARMWEVNDPKSSRGMGVGAFNLVRKEALASTPGLEWLRLEVADDVGLGIMMKRYAGRTRLLVGRGLARVEWYPSLGAAVRGLEKNGFAQAARFTASRGYGLSLGGVFLALAPYLSLLPGNPLAIQLIGGLALLGHVMTSVLVARSFVVKRRHLVFSIPVGDLIMAFIISRATWRGLRRGGVIWRGTHYPSKTLAEGRRVDL